ncbi:PKD domain-containing protein [Candidatus Acetothermia bacterium]|nr:PKD domain-containing protein [Candidatus Acetothermia bacterium]
MGVRILQHSVAMLTASTFILALFGVSGSALEESFSPAPDDTSGTFGPRDKAPSGQYVFEPANPSVGEMIRFADHSSDPDGHADIATWSWNFDDGTGSTLPNPAHTFNAVGKYNVRMVVKDHAGHKGWATKTIFVTGDASAPVRTKLHSLIREVPGSFDTNSNNVVDNKEFFIAIDAWIAGQIDNTFFFQMVDMWVDQRPINSVNTESAQTLSPAILSISQREGALSFFVSATDVYSIHLQIFSLSGERIFDKIISGKRLTWRFNSLDPERAPTGVYLYRIITRSAANAIRSTTGSFAIWR